MALLSRLFRKPKLVAPKPEVRSDDDRIAVALLTLLKPQLGLLGFDLGEVPSEGDFVSDKCRGYLFGLSGGILVCEGMDTGPNGPGFRALDAAFQLVYGSKHGTRLAVQTVQDTAAEKQDVFWASEWAIQEIQEVYRNEGSTRGSGFYLAAIGQI